MKTRSVYYFAHPVGPPCACPPMSPTTYMDRATEVACNVSRAKRWLRWCWNLAPNVSIVAPWLPHVELLNDSPGNRERGLRDNEAIAMCCDGIIHTGGLISTGMMREEIAVVRRGGAIVDLTPIGIEPPTRWGADTIASGLVKILRDLA